MLTLKNHAISRTWLFVLIGVTLGCLWPLIRSELDFKALFLFEDEWDQLRQLDQEGVWHWALSAFGENFMPLGKLAWYSVLTFAHGSYYAVIVATWLTHALNVFLMGWLLVRRGSGWAGALLAMILLGYTASTYETMAWAIQWSNVLTITFFLSALLLHERLTLGGVSLFTYGLWLTLLYASAFCFVRGIFSGLALAVLVCTPFSGLTGRRRWFVGVLAVVPAITVISSMKLAAVGGVRHMNQFDGDILSQMGLFALHCYAHNPIVNWWSSSVLAPGQLSSMALLKTIVYIAGIWLAPKRLRSVLIALVLFELVNDLALGAGRYHTGLGAAGSSRYQYTSLVAFVPFLASLFDRLFILFGRWTLYRALATAAILVGIGWFISRPWPGIMRSWSSWRGSSLRAALVMPADKAPKHISRLPWLTNEQMYELVEKYDLH